jgi:hypothetical protein
MQTTPCDETGGRWFCEAQKPGEAPHVFETFGEDAARAMCDVSGWEFLRAWREGGHGDRPEAPAPAVPGGRYCTLKQMQALLMEAKTTWDLHQSLLGDMPAFDAWRASQLGFVISGCDSFRRIPAIYYNRVKNHFRVLRGLPPVGNPGAHRKQSGERGDTLEGREQVLHLLAGELGAHARRADGNAAIQAKGGAINEAYLLTIARAKNKGHDLRDTGDLLKLPVSRLEELLYTLRNRIAAREGRGNPKNRNKGQ